MGFAGDRAALVGSEGSILGIGISIDFLAIFWNKEFEIGVLRILRIRITHILSSSASF